MQGIRHMMITFSEQITANRLIESSNLGNNRHIGYVISLSANLNIE